MSSTQLEKEGLRYVYPALEIPTAVQKAILPNPALSVLQLVAFPLPLITQGEAVDPVDTFFSHREPTLTDPSIIANIPLPPIATVTAVLEASKDLGGLNFKSVSCPHTGASSESTVPLWIITFWAEVLSIRETRQPWIWAEDALSRRMKKWGKERGLAEKAYNSLSGLSWSGKIKGFDDEEPINTLARYATHQWLTDVHEHQMLNILQRELMLDPGAKGIVVGNLWMMGFIERAYKERDMGTYNDSPYFGPVRHLGQSLASGDRNQLKLMKNLEGSHWVAFDIDVDRRAIRYGDSFRKRVPEEVIVAVEWWIQYHCGHKFERGPLPITHQNDGFSCGLLSFNALAHSSNSEKYPLLDGGAAAIDDGRLEVMLKVIERHTSYVESFEDVGADYQFTFSDRTLKGLTQPVTPAREQSPDFVMGDPQGPATAPSSSSESHIVESPTPSGITTSNPDHLAMDTSSSEYQPSPSPTATSTFSFQFPSFSSSPSPPVSPIMSSKPTPSIPSIEVNQDEHQPTSQEETPAPMPKPSFPSAIHTAIMQSKTKPHGLMKFGFNQNTREEYRAQLQKHAAEENEFARQREEGRSLLGARKSEKVKERARERQREHRERKRDTEIMQGERSPGGTKKRTIIVDLRDEPGPSKRAKHSVAELSRPARESKERVRMKKKYQGRPRVHEHRDAKYHNWFSPFLWTQIEQGAKHPSVGRRMSTWNLVKVMQKQDPVTFKKLSRNTIEAWIDRSDPERPRWSDSTLAKVEAANFQGHSHGGRKGALAGHPEVVEVIISRLKALRDAAAPLTLLTIRGIFVATILDMAPEIFEKQAADGTKFRCSDSYLRTWLHETMSWSTRRATRAAQKLPDNWEDVCEKSLLRIVHDIKRFDIPIALFINSDQTQVVYAQGSNLTWTATGSSQVSTVGEDEKRAFTVMVSVSNSGDLLPLQAIYGGKSQRSCPDKSAKNYDKAQAAGFRFEYSNTDTYWSTQTTMHNLVNEIIAPYFEKKKKELGLPPSQKAIWQIDVWSVHRSKEFRDWMKANHPNIIVHYVPAGCTGVFQACDVGIQRIFKHSLKRSYHEDVVADILAQIDRNLEKIVVDKKLGVVRNQSVTWLYNAYEALNDTKIVKKAFEMCRVKEFNLSRECLTGFAVREKLRNLEDSDPAFYEELMKASAPPKAEQYDEDSLDTDIFDDDSDLPLTTIANHCSGTLPPSEPVATADNGLRSTAQAESFDETGELEGPNDEEAANPQEFGPGKRKRRGNTLYSNFWAH